MRGITYEKERERWRCYHKSGNRVFQPRFSTQRDAFWKKIEFCVGDGIFPYGKNVKEGCKSKSKPIGALPVGIREYQSSSKGCWLIIASIGSGEEGWNKEYRYRNESERELIIRKATWERFEQLKYRLLSDAESFAPVKHSLINALLEAAEQRTQASLDALNK